MTERRSLQGLWRLAWDRLEAGVADSSAAARNLALATWSERGPQVRTLVLRGADRERASVDLHSDVASAKVAELRAEPRAALHVWDADAALQVRLAVRARILTGPEMDPIWERVPEAARFNYGGSPPPGQEIAAPEAYEPGADRARFAVLRFEVEVLEALLLEEPHLRARYSRDDGFHGEWLAP